MCRRWNVQHFRLLEQQQQGKSTQLVSNQLQKQIKRFSGRERRHQRQWQRHSQALQQQSVGLRKLTPQEHLVVGIHQYSASWTGWDQSHKLRQQQQMKEEVSRQTRRLEARSNCYSPVYLGLSRLLLGPQYWHVRAVV